MSMRLVNYGIREAAGTLSAAPTTLNLTVVTTDASQDYTVDIYAGAGINIDIDWGDVSGP